MNKHLIVLAIPVSTLLAACGSVAVPATVTVGMGPGPEIPDIMGDLDCRLPVMVATDGRVEVEVSFADTDNCLSLKQA